MASFGWPAQDDRSAGNTGLQRNPHRIEPVARPHFSKGMIEMQAYCHRGDTEFVCDRFIGHTAQQQPHGIQLAGCEAEWR